MASPSPSGERHPTNLRSFLSGPGLRILLGVGAGYVSRRLWTRPQDIANAKIAKLSEAPTIDITCLSKQLIPKEGHLALIQGGVVTPLFYIKSTKTKENRLYCKTGSRSVVLKKTVQYTDQPKELDDVFKRMPPVEKVVMIPFAVQEHTLSSVFGEGQFVIVKNVDADQLPLTHDSTMKSKFSKERVGTNAVVQVNKVTEESVLRFFDGMNVFGMLRLRKGVAEIEPSPDFPKECFTMSRSEIKRAILEEAKANAYPIRSCSVGVGLVSLGLLFSGFYSYASS